MTEGDRFKKLLDKADELVNHLFTKKTFEDIVARVTSGDPGKLAKLKDFFAQMIDQEKVFPSNFDPEVDEIPQDILDQVENWDLDDNDK